MHRGTKWVWAALLAVGVAVAAAACTSGSGSDGKGADSGKGGGKGDSTPAAIFAANCATCHGADGGGGQGPKLSDGAVSTKYTKAEMIDLITNGKGAMPAWKGNLSTAEIASVAAYIRDGLTSKSSGTTTAPGTGKRGSLSGTPPEMSAESDWATANGDYLSHRAVLDSPINSKTIDRLKLRWTYEAPGGGTFGNFTTTPLVVGDSVFIGDLTTKVHAIDRATGKERFVKGTETGIFGPTGVAAGWGQVYGTTQNAAGKGSIVVAYDASSGKQVWATDIGENKGIINMQPVAYDGLVFAATSGYGTGTKATIYALDAQTGTIVWDFVVIADPEVWGHPELNSGGGVWNPPTIDTKRGIAYFGTGNPYPFPGSKGFPNGSSRPGDNKWTDSIIALDIETGKLAWGHQLIAHDIFDRDATLTARVDTTIGGKKRALAISTGKLGIVTALDADTGKVVWKTPVGKHMNDELTEITGKTLVYPGSLGGVETPLAIADDTIYLCVLDAPAEYAGPEDTSYGFDVQLGTNDSHLIALSAATGKVVWDATLPGDSFGGATVSGDLVFTSSFGGEILALDRKTGATVWSYESPGGINGWPAIAGDELYVPVGMAQPPTLLAFKLDAG